MLLIAPHPKNDKSIHAIALQRCASEDYLFTPFKFDEADLLDGDNICYNTIRGFYDHHLPGLELTLRKLIEKYGASGIHVDLGCEMGTLYAAYYALHAGASVDVTVHDIDVIGGRSVWIKGHPLLRRHLAYYVLGKAETLFVTSQRTAAGIFKALPRLNRNLVGAPLTPDDSAPSEAALPSS